MIVLVLPDIATEDRLLLRARSGDQTAVTEIYERYFEPVYQFIRMRVDDPVLAEDLASEVFVGLVAALRGRAAPRQSLRGWIFRVARNALYDHYGRGRRLTTTTLEEWMPAPDSDSPERQTAAILEAERVREAVRRLPDDQQEVIVLRFGQMLSLEETADIMDRPVSAIKSLQFRATARLREVMSAREDGM